MSQPSSVVKTTQSVSISVVKTTQSVSISKQPDSKQPSSVVKTTQSVSISKQPDSIITIYNNGMIHLINREPYETNMDVYRRGWYIINNKTAAAGAATGAGAARPDNLYSNSLMEIYKNKGMTYDM